MYNNQFPPPVPGFQGSPSPVTMAPSVGSPWQRPPASVESGISPPPAQIWREHKNAEGRQYWFNTVTRQSTWEKPGELLTPEEKALMSCPWKEYKTPEGKIYYSHAQTKESRWVMPDEYKDLYEKAQKAKERAVAEAAAAIIPRPVPPPVAPEVEHRAPQPRPHMVRQPPPSATLLSQAPAVEFATKEEAEKAFVKLLRETGVKTDWTWERTMREIITHPMYRALKTAAERKAAFQSYVDREAKKERELREEKETKQRVAFFHMLENSREIKPYTRYRTVEKLLGHNSAFLQVKSDSQRETYFVEYVQGLQRREKERLRELRKSNMENFAELLRNIPEITYQTKWKDAQEIYQSNPKFKEPKAFEGMDLLDFLAIYDEHNHTLWQAPLADLNTRSRQHRRLERKARDGFKALLHELNEKGLITARTMWKDIYPHIKDDSRYLDLLGIPDSTPLDIFFDMLDDLDEKLYQEKKIIYDVLKQHDFEVSVGTTYEEYCEALGRNSTASERTSEGNKKIIFDHLQSKAVYRLKEEKRRQEKKLKKKMDALRYALKFLDPPVNVDDTWETVRPRVETLPEYQAIESDQGRVEAFEKFIKRLKEKHAEQDDEDEEGMIKEDEDVSYQRQSRSHSHSSRRYKQYTKRESDRDSDVGVVLGEEQARKRKKRHVASHHDNIDRPLDGGRSSAEEGEALDEYENDPRRRD